MVDDVQPRRLQRLIVPAVLRRGSVVVSAIVCSYLLALSVAWATITPIGGGPDELSHVAYAAGAVRGDYGESVATVGHPWYSTLRAVTVPAWVGSATSLESSESTMTTCFNYRPDVTANCAPEMTTSTDPQLIVTTAARYPPPYYWAVGLPTLVLSGSAAVYAMRLVGAGFAVLIIALGLSTADPSRRSWLALGTAVAVTPMVGFLWGVINPSGLEIAASLGLGIVLLGIGDETRKRALPRTILIFLLSFLLAWARPRTELTLVATAAAGILINFQAIRRWLMGDAVARFLVVPGIGLAYLSTIGYRAWAELTASTPLNDPIVVGKGTLLGTTAPPGTFSVVDNLRLFEARFLGFTQDLIGNFGYGDNSPPDSVILGWLVIVGILIGSAYMVGKGIDRLGLTVSVLGALVVAPVFVILRVFDNTNLYQARYHLPLACVMVLCTTSVLWRAPLSIDRDRAWGLLRWSAILAPVAMILSLAASLFRYSVGGRAQLIDLPGLITRFHEWLPPPTATLVATACGGVMLAVPIVLAAVTGDRTVHGPSGE